MYRFQLPRDSSLYLLNEEISSFQIVIFKFSHSTVFFLLAIAVKQVQKRTKD